MQFVLLTKVLNQELSAEPLNGRCYKRDDG